MSASAELKTKYRLNETDRRSEFILFSKTQFVFSKTINSEFDGKEKNNASQKF